MEAARDAGRICRLTHANRKQAPVNRQRIEVAPIDSDPLTVGGKEIVAGSFAMLARHQQRGLTRLREDTNPSRAAQERMVKLRHGVSGLFLLITIEPETFQACLAFRRRADR